jgi:hypothetical protein
MIESDFRPQRTRYNLRIPTVAHVPNELGGKYAGYLYLLASAEGPVLSVPGIIGGVDDSEPDSSSVEALIGRPIGPWELRTDGWYADIQCFPSHRQTGEGPSTANLKRAHGTRPQTGSLGSGVASCLALMAARAVRCREIMERVHGSLLPSQGNRGRAPTNFIGVRRRPLEHREWSHRPG